MDDDFFYTDQSDGNLGLGFTALTEEANKTSVLENAVQQKLLDKALFTIWLDKTEEKGGQLSLGELDDKNCQLESVQYFALAQKRYWEINIKKIMLDDEQLGYTEDHIVSFFLCRLNKNFFGCIYVKKVLIVKFLL